MLAGKGFACALYSLPRFFRSVVNPSVYNMIYTASLVSSNYTYVLCACYWFFFDENADQIMNRSAQKSKIICCSFVISRLRA